MHVITNVTEQHYKEILSEDARYWGHARKNVVSAARREIFWNKLIAYLHARRRAISFN
jgi:hypothetical protein